VNHGCSNGIRRSIGYSTIKAVPQAKVIRHSCILKVGDVNKAEWATEDYRQDANFPAIYLQDF
jgi:hypothetical protein